MNNGGKRLKCLLCRFQSKTQNCDEMKEHVALTHFKAYYTEEPTGKDGTKTRIPKNPNTEEGEICTLCPPTIQGQKPRVKGSKEQMIAHLAVHHRNLKKALSKRKWDYAKNVEMRDLMFPRIKVESK